MNKESGRLKVARERLTQKLGVNVGSAYGYIDVLSEEEKEPYWHLIVWSDNPIIVPDIFFGYPVARKSVPEFL